MPANPSSQLAEPKSAGAFDSYHPPSSDLINECVHCGFCLPTCPTYALWRNETDSPRGRIYLMKMALEGRAAIDPTFVSHIDNCLGCMACMTACPSGVKYDKLIEATRAQIERNYPRSAAERFLRRIIFEIFPHPNRLRRALAPLKLYQNSGMQSLVRRTKLTKLLPTNLQALEELTPRAPVKRKENQLPELIPASGPARLRVGLLLGCVQRVFFPEVNTATARVLAAEGCTVIVPPDQGCCGALMVHAGEEKSALIYACRIIDVFERADVDLIAINAAGCGSSMKEYAHLLRDDPNYAERAKKFAAKCRDISEILADLESSVARHPLPLKVAYQDACHLQHAQNVKTQPRAVLAGIPDLQILEPAESALCCGSAGIYNLIRPEPARELGQRKVQNILATAPDLVASANPGCLLQLRAHLRQSGSKIPAVHFVELIDASIRGVPAESLLKR